MSDVTPTVPVKGTGFSWGGVLKGLTRAEVVFTAIGVILPQIVSVVNDVALSHASATEFSVLAAGIFTAAEAIKDGWNKTPS